MSFSNRFIILVFAISVFYASYTVIGFRYAQFLKDTCYDFDYDDWKVRIVEDWWVEYCSKNF